ncbi:MAG: hypothetical protein JRJ00_09890 [Deltaproteobacteria bacterium]|nr:hypothetical protein [Deltaproteobacteria bacterium]
MSKENKVNPLAGLPDDWDDLMGKMYKAWISDVAPILTDTHIIYVLEDGETYSGEPTVAVEVTEAELEEIENGSKVYNVIPDWKTRGVK